MDLGKPLKKYAPVIAVLPRQRNHISCSYQRWTPGPAEKKTSLPQPVYKLTTHVPFLLPRPVLKHCQRHNRPEGWVQLREIYPGAVKGSQGGQGVGLQCSRGSRDGPTGSQVGVGDLFWKFIFSLNRAWKRFNSIQNKIQNIHSKKYSFSWVRKIQ